jgi:GTP-binding protein
MQIAILVEQMRREGFEILVSRPEVIFEREEDGSLREPMETLYVDVPGGNLGDILQSLASRKAEIVNMQHGAHNVLVEAVIPTRGLIGFETDLVNVTKGHGIASHLFKGYGPYKGEIPSRGRGVLVSMEGGISMAYALDSIQERGRLFIGPQEEIYEGMIVGENARPTTCQSIRARPKSSRTCGAAARDFPRPARYHEPRAVARIHCAR